MVTSIPEPKWKKFPNMYLNTEECGGYRESAATAMVNFLGKDDVTIAEFPVIGYHGMSRTKDPSEIYMESFKKTLKSPEGIKVLKEIFKGPEGKEILAEVDMEVNIEPTLIPICDMSRELPDEKAETEIKNFLQKLEDNNIERFSIFEIVSEINIPSEQVERILEKLLIRD